MSALDDKITRVLRQQPGLTARELARQIGGVRKRDLNPVLYRSTLRFRNDGGYVPRWYLVGTETVTRQDRVQTTARVRSQRAGIDELLRQMTERPAPSLIASNDADLDWSGEWAIAGLRPWQTRALAAWFRAGANGIIEAVTGTGKTHLGLEAASRMARMGGRTTVLVPTIELQRQWAEKFAEFAPHLSLATIGGKRWGDAVGADVVIAVAASASQRSLVNGPRPHLVVADEVHRYGSDRWSQALEPAYVARLGLTATLERGGDDGVEEKLLPFFGSKVFSYDYQQAVPENVVAPFTLVFLGVELNLEEQMSYERFTRKISACRRVLEPLGVFRGTPGQIQRNLAECRRMGGEVRRAADEFDKATRGRRNLLADVKSKPDALAELAPLVWDSHGTVIFSQKVASAERAAEVLRTEGVSAAAIHSEMSHAERRINLDALKDESLAALCAPKILDEGVDVPNIDLGIVMSASRGRRQMIQRLGRVIRLKPDGRHARFVVLYAEGTVEDPAEGAQETFIDMVRDVAAQESVVEAGWTYEEAVGALALRQPPVRRAGVA
jgi:RNA polymerase primary sigma factor